MTSGTAAFVIAPLRDDEIEAAVALWDEAGLLRPWNDPRADIAMAMSKESSDVLAGRFGDMLLTTAMIGHDGHRGWVYYLAVAKTARGRGFGMQMMRACEDWCHAKHVPKLQLMVRGDNATTQAFYDHIGYARSDVVVMAKVL